MSQLISDLRFALRSFRRKPGFTAIVVLTIAVGIASNATVFSVADALVLRPFSIPNIERLVAVFGNINRQGTDRDGVAPGDFVDFAASASAFEELHADAWWEPNLTGLDRPEKISARQVTPGYLELLGIKPHLGRTLAAERSALGRRSVVVSHSFWLGKMSGAANVIGRKIRLDGEEYEIVGVGPRGFAYPQGTELWAPLDTRAEGFDNRRFQYLGVMGLLAADATLQDAQSQLAATALRLEREFPDSNTDRAVNAMPLKQAVIDVGVPRFLIAWQIATLMVLLIACVNVANLLVARSSERQREITIRAALGARRGRVLRLLFAESLTLALTGAVLSLPLAWLGTELVRASLPQRISRFVQGWNEINLDLRVLLFAAAISVAAALAFGLLPAWHGSRTNLAAALHTGTRSTSSHQRGRGFLVAAELALATVLLVTSVLMIRGTNRITYGDQGYNPDHVLTAEINLPASEFDTVESRRQAINALLVRMSALPGVTSAEATNMLPSTGNNTSRTVEVEGAEPVTGEQRPTANFRVATVGLLELLEIPILEGRGLAESDRAETLPVVVVSKVMADQLWPGASPLGRRFRVVEDADAPWLTVVGVTGDIVHDWFISSSSPTFYQPWEQRSRQSANIALKTLGDPAELTNEVRQAAAEVHADVPLFNVFSLEHRIKDRTAGLRFMSGLMTSFGFISLALAALGVYGLMSQGVARRKHEIGVRVALGAQRGDVLRTTTGRSLRALIAGSLVGLMLAFGAAKAMAGALFGVVQLDLLSFVQTPLLLLAAAVVASLVPAWRATRLDPAKTLRSD